MRSAQPRVLVLDDSPLVLDLLRVALERSGVLVDTAITLDELEQKRAATPPDMILLDVQMPEAWGDDVAATLRMAYGVSVPIVLMSTLAPEELATRAAAAQADAFVSKREGVEKLAARITGMLDARRHAPAEGKGAGS